MASSQKTSFNAAGSGLPPRSSGGLRAWLGPVGMGVLILGLFGIGLTVVYFREQKEMRQAQADRLARELQATCKAARHTLFLVAEHCVADQDFDRKVPIDDRYDAAFASTAQETHTAPAELHRQTDVFVTWVRGNAAATPEDRALSDFAARKFSDAATDAAKAAGAYHSLRQGEETAAEAAERRSSTAGGRLKMRLTAKADAAAADGRAREARDGECTAWTLAGHLECLGKQPKAAIESYQSALASLDENGGAARRCDLTQFIAGALFEQNRNEECEVMLRKAIIERTAAMGMLQLANHIPLPPGIPRHAPVEGLSQPANIKALRNLATLCFSRRDDAAAEPVLRQLVEALGQSLGPDHADTLTALSSLGKVQMNRRNFAEAEQSFRHILEVQERTLREDDPAHIAALSDLAAALTEKGDYAGAESLFQRVAGARERTLGPDNPSTQASLNNLAALLTNKGDFEHAEPLFRKVLESQERTLGLGHATTAATARSLAVMMQARGDVAGVKALFQELMEKQEEALGPDDAATLVSTTLLANEIASEKKYAEAEPLYRRVIDARERQLGPDHLDTLNSVRDLAYLFQNKGDYAAAEPLLQRILKAQEHTLGANHPQTIGTVQNLANLYLIMGRDAAAEPLFRRALQAEEHLFGKAHPETALTAYCFSGLRRRQGKLPEALVLAQEAVDGARACLPATDRNRLLYEQQLAAVQLEVGPQDKKPPAR